MFLILFFVLSEGLFAGADWLTVEISNDTVYVWDMNAWEQCAFSLDYSIEIDDSLITITEIDTAHDMTTCYGYHDFCIPVVGLTEGTYTVDVYRDCLYEDVKYIKSTTFTYVCSTVLKNDMLFDGFFLLRAYPNPFNSVVSVGYEIPEKTLLVLSVHDVRGRRITTLVDEVQAEGNYTIHYHAPDLSSGIYFVILEAGYRRWTEKIVLIR